jgi:type IV secretory pathway VirJ component
MSQFKQAFSSIAGRKDIGLPLPSSAELKDLPLIEVPASGPGRDIMAVHITGDGGWGVTDRGLSNALAQHGIPVVGLNSLHYFWTPRTPEGVAKDLERILRYYLVAWKKDKAITIGYSMGADILPFMLNRLPEEMLSKVQLVALLGPDHTADFEFHFTDWLGISGQNALPVIPEVDRLRVKKILCFYGSEDKKDIICNSLTPGLAEVVTLKTGHRIGTNFEDIVKTILKEIKVDY